MSNFPSKIVIGTGDNALTFDENVILEISASQSSPVLTEEFDCSFCSVKIFNYGILNHNVFLNLKTIYQRIPMQVYFHGATEELFGTYMIEEYNFLEDEFVVDIQAYDILYFLNETMYETGVLGAKTLLELVEDVKNDLTRLGISVELNCDASALSISTSGYIGYVSHREAFRQIAQASQTTLYVNSRGVICFATQKQNAVAPPIIDTNIAENGKNVDYSEVISGIEVQTHDFALSTELIAIAETGDIVLTGEEQTITIEYATYPAQIQTVANSPSITIIEQNLYSERAVFKIKGTAGDTGWITLTGYAYQDKVLVSSEGTSELKVYQISNNYLISQSNKSVASSNWKRLTVPIYKLDFIAHFLNDVEMIPKIMEIWSSQGIIVDIPEAKFEISKVTRTITPDDERVEIEATYNPYST